MESMLFWLCENSDQAPFLIFFLLVIAGCSLPISEDLLLLASGALAGTVMPEKMVQLFIAALFGSYISDILAYGIGRYFGDRIYSIKWFKSAKTRVQHFYKKYGTYALVIGRCIPFGLRNGIFMSAGAARMHFGRFLLSDAIACALFSSALFFLAYSFGSNYEPLYGYVQQGGLILLAISVVTIGLFAIIARTKKTVKV